MRHDFLLTYTSAQQVIRNTKEMVKQEAREYGQAKIKEHSGILQPKKQLFSRIDDCILQYGVRVAGTALERVRSNMVFTDRTLYYEADPGISYDNDQWDFVERLLYDLYELSDKFEEEITKIQEEKEKAELQQKQDYERLRSNLMGLIRRRKAFGISIEAPKIPKTITEGSINQIKKTIAKVKSDYRYLVGRGYRKGR